MAVCKLWKDVKGDSAPLPQIIWSIYSYEPVHLSILFDILYYYLVNRFVSCDEM